jgi:hypothetical protein
MFTNDVEEELGILRSSHVRNSRKFNFARMPVIGKASLEEVIVKLKRLFTVLIVAVLGAALLAGPVVAQTAARPPLLGAQMTGEQEVPGPGDPDGSGRAIVWTSPPDKVCYSLTVRDIAPANAAHIHKAPPGVAGPVVVALKPPTSGVSGGCTKAAPALVSAIAGNPSNYYVNVHNAPYPEGAIRGQLSRGQLSQ